MQTVDRDSREYVGALVTVTDEGTPYDPTNDVVDFAFTSGSARPTTWYPGGWDDGSTGASTYRAQVLIGPGSTVPAFTPGKYTVWLRITDNPEQPVINVGWLSIT